MKNIDYIKDPNEHLKIKGEKKAGIKKLFTVRVSARKIKSYKVASFGNPPMLEGEGVLEYMMRINPIKKR